jgi:hypothetical protein
MAEVEKKKVSRDEIPWSEVQSPEVGTWIAEFVVTAPRFASAQVDHIRRLLHAKLTSTGGEEFG